MLWLPPPPLPPTRLAPLDPPLRCIHIVVPSLMIISPLNSQPSSPDTLPGHPALTLFPELTRQKVEKAVSNKSLCHQQLATRESPQHVARSHLPPGLGSAPPASSQVCFGGLLRNADVNCAANRKQGWTQYGGPGAKDQTSKRREKCRACPRECSTFYPITSPPPLNSGSTHGEKRNAVEIKRSIVEKFPKKIGSLL